VGPVRSLLANLVPAASPVWYAKEPEAGAVDVAVSDDDEGCYGDALPASPRFWPHCKQWSAFWPLLSDEREYMMLVQAPIGGWKGGSCD
jgi:hypothetical protein